MMQVPVANESDWIRRVAAALKDSAAPDSPAELQALRNRLVPLAWAKGCPHADAFALDGDGGRFRRHPLAVAGIPGSSALVMYWPPGYSTLPHDHAGLWGIELVIDGVLQIDEFLRVENPVRPALTLARSLYLGLGDAAVFSGDAYVHRCRNLSTTRAALSLHVYGGPLDAYNAFHADVSGGYRVQSEIARNDCVLG
jgi:cysteine dioxygenase type I